MAKMRISLRFPREIVKKPIIWKLGKDFNVITNIRRANIVEDDIGWMLLELEGEINEIEKAMDNLIAQGVRVDPIEGDIMEG